ncbi:META domain-containing protein [Fibrella forsythiae]|uniref:META domain-containing protein n=1 Tax=Fibrella forsythiae TaxID=2817061 RepID=A0ABS3JKL9_9BACT|nr:META domain-containing protein [Fibrella forsythiae]MBO0950558.1 META domain-containing protein [Fibrella forsythiae]
MNTSFRFWRACFALLLLGVTGCSPKETATPVPAGSADAISGDWVLVEPASAYTITLRITGAGPSFIEHYAVELAGKAPVNNYFGKAAFSQRPSIESGPTGTGSVSGLGSTQMAGPPAAMQFEADYLAHLGAVNKAEVVGTSRLELSYGGTAPGKLVYKRQ